MNAPKQSGGRERRRHPRTAFFTEVWFGQDAVFTRASAHLSNVSIRGAFIQTPQSYAVGTVFNLRFAFRSNFITATAIVRNARLGEGIGVEFLDLSPENVELLSTFVGTRT